MTDMRIYTTPSFDKKADELLTQEAREQLLDYLEKNPEAGDIIAGTGGIRKLRWMSGKNNKGKSGGIRVLYHYTKAILILLITLYSKSEKDNITQKERNQLKAKISMIIAQYKED